MNVFISWSGELSRQIAMHLRDWLPSVIQEIEPFVSDEDIDKGTPWSARLGEQLSTEAVGVFCVTRENIGSPWLNYEAGALSKQLDESRVIPFLFLMRPTDVRGPLAQFQAATYGEDADRNKVEMRRLLSSLNAVQSKRLQETRLTNAYAKWWPEFETSMNELATKADELMSLPPKEFSMEDALQEILIELRNQNRSANHSSLFGSIRSEPNPNSRIKGWSSSKIPSTSISRTYTSVSDSDFRKLLEKSIESEIISVDMLKEIVEEHTPTETIVAPTIENE